MKKMRLIKREIQDKDTLKDIVSRSKTIRVGTIDEEGMFIVPLSFGYDWETGSDGEIRWSVYIHSAKEGRKAEAFRIRPDVAVELDVERGVITGTYTCSYSFSYQSIMGNGKICCLEDPEEKEYGLKKIMEHMEPSAVIDFLPEMLERVDVYRIDIISFTGKER